ncbi:MAG TPA: MFS transporter [Pyrinomonadaceae bacterium]|nr:MFS transporter [Pyrinomonadaceae bacterium]
MPDTHLAAPPPDAPPPDSKARPSTSPFSVLRHRDFRLLWAGQFVSIMGSQMQLVAINWHVYLLTRSSVALGLVGLVRVVPIVLCSLAGGVVADAFDRKRLMVAAQVVMLASAGALSALTAVGAAKVWIIYLLTALSSAATSFENPARQALVPALVPAADLPQAISLGLITFQTATVTGPLVAGLVLGAYGPAPVYAANAASFLAVMAAVLMLRSGGRAEGEEIGVVSFEALREGLRFVRRTPVIVQTMALDFVATFFASATALLPIFAREILRVDARGYGLLAASPAAGSVVVGLVMARFGWIRRPGATVLASVAVYGAATLAFGLSRVFWLSCASLAVVGAADTVSTVVRQTVRQLVTPDRLRGRMTSVNMIFFMGGPQLGELEAGLLAAALGAPLSVVVGGVGTIVAVTFAALKARELLRYRFAHDRGAD